MMAISSVTASWTTRECDLLESLSLRVRVLTAEQIASAWFEDLQQEECDSSIDSLVKAGLVEQRQVYAHPMIPVRPPVFQWKPGDPHPTDEQLQELAQIFQSRWSDNEEVFTVYTATPEAASLFGSHMLESPSEDQWTHDIHVAEVYTDLKKTNSPEDLRYVVGEGALPKLGKQIRFMKDPDLFLLDEHGQAKMVIEFAGAYDFEHVKQLHEHCSGGAHQKMHKHFRGVREHLLYPDREGTPYLLV